MFSRVLGRAAVTGALAGVALLVAVPSASAVSAQRCSAWGPGDADSMKVCASASGGKIHGKGYTRGSANGAVVWIEAVNTSTGKKYGAHVGKSLSKKVPRGRYEVTFYRGDGGAVDSPVVKV